MYIHACVCVCIHMCDCIHVTIVCSGDEDDRDSQWWGVSSMCVYTNIYVCIYMYICIYVCVCVCVRLCRYVHASVVDSGDEDDRDSQWGGAKFYVCIYRYLCVCIYIHIYMYTCVCVCVCIHMCNCIHVSIVDSGDEDDRDSQWRGVSPM